MPSPDHLILAHAVQARFQARPTLRSATAQRLSDSLKELSPPLTRPLSELYLAHPRDGGGRALPSVLQVALTYLANGTLPDLATRAGLDAYLSDASGNRLTEPAIPLNDLQRIIRELPTLLPATLQTALSSFWDEVDSAGISHWQWLGEVLHSLFRQCAISQSTSDREQLQALTALARYPAREARRQQTAPDNTVYAYTLEALLVRGQTRLTLQCSELLIVSGERVWLYSLPGTVEAFASLQAFGQAWGERLEARYLADRITWRQYEPDGDIFELQAALLLNRQLDDLAALCLPAHTPLADLESQVAALTDLAPGFISAPAAPTPPLDAIDGALPAWLKNASASERFSYRQCLLEQASLRRLNGGAGYLDGIDDIRRFAARSLNPQLCQARNAALKRQDRCTDESALAYRAEDLQLTFAVSVGTLQSGYVQPVTLSLVDLALKNLCGKPSGSVTLHHRSGRPIEAWLTPDYLMRLVQYVDIGRTYPAYLREQLLAPNAQAQRRQQLFIQQHPVRLKLQALEALIKGEAGLTRRGVHYVCAVLGASRAQRWVQGTEIIMRPLAFKRKADAQADTVPNMFIIEARNGQEGPHLLYRPAYQPALLEFPSRAQLLSAITRPGPLQDSVLTWLPDSARAIYSNGGFLEPHIIRFYQGSEFDVLPSRPSPATLAEADDESADEMRLFLNNNRLLEYLFGAEARQLVELAERESTSNSESRWALLLEGVQLGFNTLLVVARGPLAVVGWMLQMMQGLRQDLPNLQSADPVARELAWVDLLLNIAMVLMHQAQAGDTPIEATRHAQTQARLPLRRPLSQPLRIRQTDIRRGTVGLPAEPPGGGRTLLDFDRSLASDSAAGRLLDKLLSVHKPWPQPTPKAMDSGPLKGLFNINGRWHASVGGLLFEVSVVPGFGEVYIIHPDKPEHPGIKLKTDGQGQWRLDRGLKLEGGGPKRIAALREESRRRKEALVERLQTLSAEIPPRMRPLEQALDSLADADKRLADQTRVLKLTWTLLDKASEQQKPALRQRHGLEVKRHSALRAQFEILLERLSERLDESSRLRQELVSVGQELEQVGGAGVHVQDRAKVLETLWNQQFSLHHYQRNWANALLFSDSGEPMTQVEQRMVVERAFGDLSAYYEHVARSIDMADALERLATTATALEDTLERLEQDSAAGRAIRQKLLALIIEPQNFFGENMRLRALSSLASVAIVDTGKRLPPQEALYVERLDRLDIHQAVQSHISVRSSEGFALDDQRNLYESLLDSYRSYANGVQALKAINPARLNASIVERFVQRLDHAQTLAQTELENVVRAQEALAVSVSLAKTLRSKPATSRVFKTRKRHYRVGEVTRGTRQQEQLTITDSFTGSPISTFEATPDGWAQVLETPEAPAVITPSKPSFATLREEGRGLIRQRAAIERTIDAQQLKLDDPRTRQSIDPADWDHWLDAQARQLDGVADALAGEHANQTSAMDLAEEFRNHARDMRRTAEQRCSAAYKKQWPSLDGIDYLWRHQQIDINLTSLADPQRPTLSGDFFTEYAVYDKAQKPPQVLWYAHFHYATATAPAAEYTRAHLKLPEQRKYTQKDLLKAAVQARLLEHSEPGAVPLRSILYVRITPPLDRLFLAIAPPAATRA
ncbi:dermonecrotic toxin domain-containing protein [Pseudomonas rhodesiae]|uniref:dermonecrotic toxin domain-containing protein n=1 Tax=Pseudomonas rhodesiae TaxID=76760 RepID=UPI0032B21C16